MSKLRALIFDVDGTLAETEELHRESFNQSFQSAGLPWFWTKDLYGKLLQVTGGKERIRFYQNQSDNPGRLSDADIAALHKDKTARYTKLVSSHRLSLRPGVERLIQEARSAGVRLAIATTTSRPNVEALLRAAMGYQPFEVIAAGDEVPAKKPAPDVYLLALSQLELPAEHCLALEDTPNGLRSATGAGIACLVTMSAYGGDGPFKGALAILNHLGDSENAATVVTGPALAGSTVTLADLEAWFASCAPRSYD